MNTKQDFIKITWGNALSYEGSIDNLKPALETVFEKLPPAINNLAPEQIQQQLALVEEEEGLVGYS